MKNALTAAFVALTSIALTSSALAGSLYERIAANPNAKKLGDFKVISVIDGDTIVVQTDDGKQNIRFIGVNAPEKDGPYTAKQQFSEEAKKFIQDAIKASNDKVELYSEGRDKSYERYLRWVIVKTPDGKRELGELLIAEGLGTVYKDKTFIPDDKEREILIALETKAKAGKKGIWSTPLKEKERTANGKEHSKTEPKAAGAGYFITTNPREGGRLYYHNSGCWILDNERSKPAPNIQGPLTLKDANKKGATRCKFCF